MLKRKIDYFLERWKDKVDKKPLIIKGARQVGKTTSIEHFSKKYSSFVEINFKESPEYINAFKNGYDVENIIKGISLINPSFKFIKKDTLILFDEIQEYPDAITSLKFFAINGDYDIICSGSLLGVNYKKISSIPVGYKEEYCMYSLDFEEFLWAKGYDDSQITDILNHMIKLIPFNELEFNVYSKLFREYIFLGGMPEVINNFINTKDYNEPFAIQKRIYKDYEDDIIKYVEGLNCAKIKNMYRHISSQLAKDNHKFQVTKLSHGARSRDYIGCEEWLLDAGIINIAYNLSELKCPFKSYEDGTNFRIYFADHGLFITSIDEESKKDIIINDNYNIYNGALYESLISECLNKQGYDLYFYKNIDSTIELDFLVRSKNEIIPIEVKAKRGRTKSLNTLLNDKNINIKHGIIFSSQNIGFDGDKLTLPHFTSFLLSRFLEKNDITSW